VLQHCEFKIESRVQSPVKWLQDFKNELKDVNVIVQEKRTGSEEGVDEEEDVDATVRTVEADEDEIQCQMGMRSISVHVLRCVHETQNVVFKVTVTMMSPDAGQQNPYPVVAFDLQVGTSPAPPNLLHRAFISREICLKIFLERNQPSADYQFPSCPRFHEIRLSCFFLRKPSADYQFSSFP
jgi:hypothetical protein